MSAFFASTIGRLFLAFAARTPFIAAWLNRLIINGIVNRARNRPHPYSTLHDYTSWRSLTDQEWSGRHLRADHRGGAPDEETPSIDDLMALFRRPDGAQRMCPKSTCLFPAFAQYLTDGFLRTVSDQTRASIAVFLPSQPGDDAGELDRRLSRNTSNHNIDLSPLYGRIHAQTLVLREQSEETGRRGRMKTQMIDGEEFAPFLFENDIIKEDFEILDPPLGLKQMIDMWDRDADDRPPGAAQRATLFAFGGDRANSVPQVSMMNTLFLREHNRLAGEIEAAYPHWDDERVFETARNTVIAIFIKIVVEDYINHIAPIAFPLRADPKAAWRAKWNRPNWITTEFSLLYRWHALIPDEVRWGDWSGPVRATFLNNAPLLAAGLQRGFQDMSGQGAAELGPQNTTDALLHVEAASIRQDRATGLASYARYRRYIGGPAKISFEDISSDPKIISLLYKLYDGDPHAVEFFPGIFAEDRVADSPLPRTILSMVALDAFSQALTNPLFSEHVFNPDTFSRVGWAALNETSTLRQLVLRNVAAPDADAFIGMTRRDWRAGRER